MEFTCPHCDQLLTADDTAAGQVIDCPTCSGSMVAPDAPDAPDRPAPDPAPEEPAPSPVRPTARTRPQLALAVGLAVALGALAGLGIWFAHRVKNRAPDHPPPGHTASRDNARTPEHAVKTRTPETTGTTASVTAEHADPEPAAPAHTATGMKPADEQPRTPPQPRFPPPLEQRVNSLRVVFADTSALPKDELTRAVRAAYEPHGIQLVFSKAVDMSQIKEDAVLLTTYAQRSAVANSTDYTARHLWLDIRRRTVVAGNQVKKSSWGAAYGPPSGFRAEVLAGLVPPLFVRDMQPNVSSRVITDDEGSLFGMACGALADDGQYLLYVKSDYPSKEERAAGKQPVHELLVFDTASATVQSRKTVHSGRVQVFGTTACCAGTNGVELIDFSRPPALADPVLLFPKKNISALTRAGNYLLAVVDEQVQVIALQKIRPMPRTDAHAFPCKHLVAGPKGQVWLFGIKPKDEEAPRPVRIARVGPDGKLRVEGETTTDTLGYDNVALGGSLAVAYERAKSMNFASYGAPQQHELRLFSVQRGRVTLIRSVTGIPADDVFIYGRDLLIVLHGAVLRFYALDPKMNLYRVLDVPLGAQVPVQAMGKKLSLVDLGMLLSMGAFSSNARLAGEKVIALSSGMVLTKGDDGKTTMRGTTRVHVVDVRHILATARAMKK